MDREIRADREARVKRVLEHTTFGPFLAFKDDSSGYDVYSVMALSSDLELTRLPWLEEEGGEPVYYDQLMYLATVVRNKTPEEETLDDDTFAVYPNTLIRSIHDGSWACWWNKGVKGSELVKHLLKLEADRTACFSPGE